MSRLLPFLIFSLIVSSSVFAEQYGQYSANYGAPGATSAAASRPAQKNNVIIGVQDPAPAVWEPNREESSGDENSYSSSSSSSSDDYSAYNGGE